MRLAVDPRCARVAWTPDNKPLLRRTDGRWTPPKNPWILYSLLRSERGRSPSGKERGE